MTSAQPVGPGALPGPLTCGGLGAALRPGRSNHVGSPYPQGDRPPNRKLEAFAAMPACRVNHAAAQTAGLTRVIYPNTSNRLNASAGSVVDISPYSHIPLHLAGLAKLDREPRGPPQAGRCGYVKIGGIGVVEIYAAIQGPLRHAAYELMVLRYITRRYDDKR